MASARRACSAESAGIVSANRLSVGDRGLAVGFRRQHLQEYVTNELFTTLLRVVRCKHTHPGVDHGRRYLLLIKHSPSPYQRQRIAIYREANPTGNGPVSLLFGWSVEPLVSKY